MRKTPNLNLPIYDAPETDIFNVQEWNVANETIDNAYKNMLNEQASTVKKVEDIKANAINEINLIKVDTETIKQGAKSYLDEIPKINANAEIIEAREGASTLGANVKRISSSLEQKAQRSEIRVSTDVKPINVSEMDTETKKLFTGGAVAVVGTDAVGKENLKKKSVGISKIDHSIVRNPLTNLLSTELYVGTGNNGASFTTQDNNTYTVTSTTNYGTFNRIVNVEDYRVYIIISKCRLIDGVSAKFKHIAYCYSEQGANLGANISGYTSLDTNYKTIVDKISMKPTAFTCHFGVTVDRACTIEVTNQIILDVTGLSEENLNRIDFTKFNNGYWLNSLENIMLYAELSNKSKTSDFAEVSNTSNYALDGDFAKYIQQYNNIMGGFRFINSNNRIWGNGATITVSEENKELLVSPDLVWGQLLIWCPNKVGTLTQPILYNRKYKLVAKIKSDVAKGLNASCYMYSSGNTQLGYININVSGITNEYKTFASEFTITMADCHRVAIGYTNITATTPYPPFKVKDIMLIDVTDTPLTNEQIFNIDDAYWETYPKIVDFSNRSLISQKAMSLDESYIFPGTSRWRGKNILVIGDSITAAGKWQLKLSEMLGANVKTHAKGGVGIVAMVDGDKGLTGDYDNTTNASGTLYPLNTTDVQNVDLIVVLPAYNERALEYGNIGDVYPINNTMNGKIQYLINRIYEELTKANNLKCKLLIATPHCAGKYNYVDADGYEQYPSNSGRTMETMSNTIKAICNYNNIPVCDLWHNSGINKFTWSIYGNSPSSVNDNYTKYELNSTGQVIGTTPLRYITGGFYYQIRNGVAVFEKYTEASPYPFNGDQLHCSTLGYYQIGECIVGSIINSYGY